VSERYTQTSGALQHVIDHPRLVPAMIVAAGVAVLAVAFAAQIWGGIQPCVLCLYQRYAYGVAIGFGVAGVALGQWPRARRAAVALAGLAFLGVSAIAAFHVGVEQHWWRGTAECHAPAFDPNASIDQLREQLLAAHFVACDEIPWSLFGISIAGYDMIVSLILAAATLWVARRIGAGRAS
jgi:disulfide bond formation protein DsbB